MDSMDWIADHIDFEYWPTEKLLPYAMLVLELSELTDAEFNLGLTGFSASEIDDLLKNINEKYKMR